MPRIFEEELRNNTLLRHLYENSKVNAMLVADADGYILHLNEAFHHNYGYTLEDLLGRHVRVLFTEEDQKKLLPEMEIESVKQQGSFRDHNYVMHRDGSCIWTDGESVLTKNERGTTFVIKTIQNIHEQKVMEKFLQDAREFSEYVISSIDEGLVVIDPDGKILKANQCFFQLLGREEASADGVHLSDLNDPLFASASFNLELQRLINERKFTKLEFEHPSLNGSSKILSVKARFLSNEPASRKILIILSNLTAERKAANKIKHSEERLRNLIEEATVAMGVYTGKEMRIQYVNEAMLKIMDKDASVIEKPFKEAMPELEGQPFFALLDHVYATGETYSGKEDRADIVVDGNLQTFYFNFSYKALRDGSGAIYGILNIAVDVTEQVLAQKRLQESEKALRTLIMEAPVGICLVNKKELKVEVVNDTFLQLVGKNRSGFDAHPYWEVIPEAKEFYAPILDSVFETGITYRGEEHELMLVRNRRNETVHVNFVYEPLKDENGLVNRVMILAIDVTEQVLARQKIEEMVEKRTRELSEVNLNLQRSNDRLEEFAYAASHDLKEPIRKLYTFSERIKSKLAPRMNEEELQLFGRLENAAERMRRLVDDLLEYSHVSNRLHEKELVDLNKKITLVLDDLEIQIKNNNAEVTVHALPVVRGYRRQLQQLFQNLIGNAIKYSKPGVPPHIHITSQTVKGGEVIGNLPEEENNKLFYLINVQDNGIGFEQEYAERIFQMFFRLHGKAEYGGTGIGLAIVRKVMDNHQGYIWAESEPEKGTSFKLLLPAE